MGCGSSAAKGAAAGEPDPIGPGDVKAAPRAQAEAGKEQQQVVRDVTDAPSSNLNQKSEAPSKIYVRFEATGKSTAVTLTGEQVVRATTWRALAEILQGPGHLARLKQLGYDGSGLLICDVDWSSVASPELIRKHEDPKNPLNFTSKHAAQAAASQQSAASNGGHASQQNQTASAHRPPVHMSTTTSPSRPPLGVVTSPSRTESPTGRSEASYARSNASSSPGPYLQGSPAEKAHRAEVHAVIEKYNKGRPAPKAYKPDESVPEIKRDMLSHLKKKEAESSTAQTPTTPSPSKESLAAFEKPKSLAVEKDVLFSMDRERLDQLSSQLEGFVKLALSKDKNKLLKELKGALTPQGWASLQEQVKQEDGAWSGVECLGRLRGYLDFVQHHKLGKKGEKVPLEFRNEEDGYYPLQLFATPKTKKSYALVPVEWSLMRSFQGAKLGYLLDDGEGFGFLSRWATGRLLDPAIAAGWEGPETTRPLFGFLGQMPGVSKQMFVNATGLPFNDRDECMKRCRVDDPDEYPVFSTGMDVYLVQIDLSKDPTLADLLAPRVVIDAAIYGLDPTEDASMAERFWRTQPGFGEACLPGFTNSGNAVLLVNSVQIPGASSADSVRSRGILCEKIPQPTGPSPQK